MTSEQLTRQVEQIHERNKAAIKRTRERSRRLERAAERSAVIVEQAMRQLRRGY